MRYASHAATDGEYSMYIISPEKFAALPPEEQDRLMKEYSKDLSTEERKVLKK